MKKLITVALILPLLAACAEDRNGPGYHSSRVGYDVHAPEYHGHDDHDDDRNDRDEDNSRAREDQNCPWKGSC